MKTLRLVLTAVVLTPILLAGVSTHISLAEAQSSTPTVDSKSARDATTSREDISLTNSCIESGKEKIYCLCVTKIFKNEMTLREYRAAVEIYNIVDTDSELGQQGYSPSELTSVRLLSQKLSSEKTFRTLCDEAETYFSAATEG